MEPPNVPAILRRERPKAVRDVELPRRAAFHPSPQDWRDEVLYFLLPDRFSDGQEERLGRALLDRGDLAAARPALPSGQPWRWDLWAQSGAHRWQGGTLEGVRSKLDYLRGLGVTAIWIGPVFRQRVHLDTYHGYGVQDFLDVDPHFGTREDLVALVQAAHERGLRVILDIIFNHSGANWLYPAGTPGGELTPDYTGRRYPFGVWRGDRGQGVAAIGGRDDGVWPAELQDPEGYTRAGSGDLGRGDIGDPRAEHKRSDFSDLRDLRLSEPRVLADIARCYKYWIALTDCDGFRIDTLKHVSMEEARNFCGAIKEFAANLGKRNFLLIGEVAGGDYNQGRYLDALERNLNAVLDIGEMRPALERVAKGRGHPWEYFAGFGPARPDMGSHRNVGLRHASILDDHDHVTGEKIRFSSEADSDHQVVAGVALQLLTLGLPCVYYGTEQGFGGPEPAERQWLPAWKGQSDYADRYLREAMFGPSHPRRSGAAGLQVGLAGVDRELPGFGPFGTAGRHCFDAASPIYTRIAALAAVRGAFPVLRYGRQYLRPTSFLGRPFDEHGPGEIVAWSRILDDEEALCVLNSHGTEARGADVLVDAALSPSGSVMHVVANTGQAAVGNAGYAGTHPSGSAVEVRGASGGGAYVEIRGVGPSEVLVLVNHG